MIYEVITTDQANADLKGIYEYIAFELLSPDNAAGQLERLEEHIVGLEESPEKFRHYEKEPWYSRGLRACLKSIQKCKNKTAVTVQLLISGNFSII